MHEFSHILVPVDFTPPNQTALARAFQIAEAGKARVTLLHVIEEVPQEEGEEDEEIRAFYEMLQQRAERKMQELIASPSQDGQVAAEIVIGRRGPEIVRFALENDVDLVVMSSHRINPEDFSRGWATLSYQVSIVCPCAVLLVK